MQIHLPTWGLTADREDINLFKIEDNIDFGACKHIDAATEFVKPEELPFVIELDPFEVSTVPPFEVAE